MWPLIMCWDSRAQCSCQGRVRLKLGSFTLNFLSGPNLQISHCHHTLYHDPLLSKQAWGLSLTPHTPYHNLPLSKWVWGLSSTSHTSSTLQMSVKAFIWPHAPPPYPSALQTSAKGAHSTHPTLHCPNKHEGFHQHPPTTTLHSPNKCEGFFQHPMHPLLCKWAWQPSFNPTHLHHTPPLSKWVWGVFVDLTHPATSSTLQMSMRAFFNTPHTLCSVNEHEGLHSAPCTSTTPLFSPNKHKGCASTSLTLPPTLQISMRASSTPHTPYHNPLPSKWAWGMFINPTHPFYHPSALQMSTRAFIQSYHAPLLSKQALGVLPHPQHAPLLCKQVRGVFINLPHHTLYSPNEHEECS